MSDLPKGYEPAEIEPRWYAEWMARGYFHADAAAPKAPFAIVIPPPNVTGSLHMGHALGDTIEDIFTRWRRMAAYNAMWLPGTDHAGIATQMVVERELRATEKARAATTSAARPSSSARLGLAAAHRRPDLRRSSSGWAARSTGSATVFTMDPALLGGGDRGLRAPLRRGAHLPGAAPHQLVPQLPDGALGPGGRLRRGDGGGAVRVRLPAGRRLGRGGGRDHAPRDDAGRHRHGRPPRRSAPPGRRSASWSATPS